MSEEQNAQSEDGAQGKFNIQKIYVKDLSFEAPNTPEIFTEEWDVQNNLDLNTSTKALADNIFEVVLSITVTAKLGDKTAFLIEVQQAGIFHLEGFSDNDKHGMLGSYCPNLLFPYAREAVSDVVTRGGFPPLILAPINFDVLYHQHMQQQSQQDQTVN